MALLQGCRRLRQHFLVLERDTLELGPGHPLSSGPERDTPTPTKVKQRKAKKKKSDDPLFFLYGI